MKTTIFLTMAALAATGMAFGQLGQGDDASGESLAGAGEMPEGDSSKSTLTAFDFEGGTLNEFAEVLGAHVKKIGIDDLNIIVTESVKELAVPPMRVRRVSSQVLLETAAQLSGADIRAVEAERGRISAPVFILEKPSPPPSASYYRGGRTTSRNSDGAASAYGAQTSGGVGGTSPARTVTGSTTARLGSQAASGSTKSSRQGTTTNAGGIAGGFPRQPVYNSLGAISDDGLGGIDAKPNRIVIPLFYGYLFADKKGDEALMAREDALAKLEVETRKYFPTSNTELSTHDATQTVVVQSESQEAVDFVKAWLAAQQEAAAFKVKAALYKSGALPFSELLGR